MRFKWLLSGLAAAVSPFVGVAVAVDACFEPEAGVSVD